MRVALVSPYDLGVPGGVQSHVLHLAAALRATGDEVVVVAPGRGRSPVGGYAGTGRAVGLPFNGSVAPIGLGPLSGVRTRRYLTQIAPDVLHVHEPLVPAVGLAAATAGVAPVVATFHAWSSADRAYRLVRPVGRHVLDGLAAAIAVSRAAADYHAGALGVDPGRFAIVPNGVDASRFADGGDGGVGGDVADGPPTLLFVGRLEPRKGLETLIRAFVQLRAARSGVVLSVVGEGPEAARCRSLLPADLREDVRFLGRVSDEVLARCYADADVYVSPASGGESFGIVLLEAMAAGTPVVASDIPGYRSVVTDGRDGLLVPAGDPAALAHALAALLDDPARRQRLVAAGSLTAAAHDWPVVARRVREVYATALGTAPDPG